MMMMIYISEVHAYLKIKIDSNKSPGPDSLSPRVLKECIQQLELPITLMFNKSLWKMSNVTPIFKEGDKKASQKLSSY